MHSRSESCLSTYVAVLTYMLSVGLLCRNSYNTVLTTLPIHQDKPVDYISRRSCQLPAQAQGYSTRAKVRTCRTTTLPTYSLSYRLRFAFVAFRNLRISLQLRYVEVILCLAACLNVHLYSSLLGFDKQLSCKPLGVLESRSRASLEP